jgi:hypothetical protein
MTYPGCGQGKPAKSLQHVELGLGEPAAQDTECTNLFEGYLDGGTWSGGDDAQSIRLSAGKAAGFFNDLTTPAETQGTR